MDAAISRAEAELRDPNSIYYIGGPSSIEKVHNYLNRTNYFGSDAHRYLAPRTCDTVEIYSRCHERREKRRWFYTIGIIGAAILAYMGRGKIPLIGKFLKKTPKT